MLRRPRAVALRCVAFGFTFVLRRVASRVAFGQKTNKRTPKVTSFRDVEPGDCVVGFSRRSLFQFKRQIEEAHGFETKACIVYGGLPPETRKDQAGCCWWWWRRG